MQTFDVIVTITTPYLSYAERIARQFSAGTIVPMADDGWQVTGLTNMKLAWAQLVNALDITDMSLFAKPTPAQSVITWNLQGRVGALVMDRGELAKAMDHLRPIFDEINDLLITFGVDPIIFPEPTEVTDDGAPVIETHI